MRDSTIRGLRKFCVAAKHASFKHAARELCVPMLKEFTDAYEGLEVRVDAATWGERHRSTSDASVLLLAEKPGDCVAVELFPLNLIPACSQALAASFDFSDEVALANET